MKINDEEMNKMNKTNKTMGKTKKIGFTQDGQSEVGSSVKRIDSGGGFDIYDCETGKYAVALGSSTSYEQQFSTFFDLGAKNWDVYATTVMGVKCVPFGINNDMPEKIRDIMEKNNLGPGILQRKIGLLYGQGPMLCRNEIVDNEIQQTWINDKEIQDWLESWNYKAYIRQAMTEYVNMGGHFTKYVSGRAVRIGRKWVARLECLPTKDCRLVWPDGINYPYLEDIKQILVGDMVHNREAQIFPVFDKWHPTKSEAAIRYHNLRSFGRNLYSISSFHGSIPWMQNANDIADIVRVLHTNMIAAAYIVHEPAAYWELKKQDLFGDHPEYTDAQVATKIEEMKKKVTKQIAEVMSGKENAGKFFTCVDFVDDNGKSQEWKIEPIEMNLDKYISAEKDISRIADSATTSGLGLSPSLANIIIDGKSDSGSQMLYALKIFYGADTQIASDVILEAMNDAIRINFPQKKDVFMSFYHKVVNKEDNVSAGKRAIDNV